MCLLVYWEASREPSPCLPLQPRTHCWGTSCACACAIALILWRGTFHWSRLLYQWICANLLPTSIKHFMVCTLHLRVRMPTITTTTIYPLLLISFLRYFPPLHASRSPTPSRSKRHRPHPQTFLASVLATVCADWRKWWHDWRWNTKT